MPMPRGNRPSTAAFTSVGDRKASEIVTLTCRTLHFSRGRNLLYIGNDAGNNLVEPTSAAGDRHHKREACLRANGANILTRGCGA
jgi:hypothetical protein